MPESIFTIDENAAIGDLSTLFSSVNITETRLPSMRKAIALLKHQQPDYILAEFEYGYGNNYAGVNISNLDVMLYSLQKYSPQTKVVVLVEKSELQYVDKLNEIFQLHAVLSFPVDMAQLKKAIV